jgi:hypothetical protein
LWLFFLWHILFFFLFINEIGQNRCIYKFENSGKNRE